ncbi:MAG: methylated-DNA--[protein]-cysteine S-methyltransferase [Deltaproteobacteria bacterium]|nr:methylated-DNA--[protein]-cysteine S-methyltransferase [Deltaproteobacteria bacterium]
MKMKRTYLRNEKIMYAITPSLRGDIGIIWTLHKGTYRIIAVLLPGKKKMERAVHDSFPGAAPGSRREIGALGRILTRYVKGENVKIPLAVFDMERLYPFQKKVLMKCRQIPRGKVLSYGRLAEKIGAPKAARAAGTALARNPFPLVLPCHRVVQATGRPGNFGGSPPMKVALLAGEGVRLSERGIVDAGSFWK